MRPASRSKFTALTTALLCALPSLASAMAQCPQESSKSTAFWLLGWSIFALFVGAGVVLLLLIFRATRSARPWPRWLLRIASIPAMLAMWMLGLGIFLGKFAFVC